MRSILYGKLLNTRKSLGFIILMLFLPIAMTFVFGGLNEGGGKQTLFVANEDGTLFAQRLINEIEKTNTYNINLVSTKEMNKLFLDRRADFGILIPSGFKTAIEAREQVDIKLYRTVENADFYALQGILQGVLQAVDNKNNIVYEGVRILTEQGQNQDAVQRRLHNLVEERWSGALPLLTRSRVHGEEVIFITQKTHASLGFLLFFSMYPIVFILGEILEDKRLRVWDRLIVSSISRIKLYASNLLFVYGIGMVQMLILLALNYLIFKIEFGNNLPGVLLIVGAFVFAVSALGLFISSFVKTNQQLSSFAPVIIVSTSMLGGLFWPSELIGSSIIQTMSRLTPQFWAMEAMKKIVVYNLKIEHILLNVFILIMMGILLMSTAIQIKEIKN